jgi:hypothetical protein
MVCGMSRIDSSTLTQRTEAGSFCRMKGTAPEHRRDPL